MKKNRSKIWDLTKWLAIATITWFIADILIMTLAYGWLCGLAFGITCLSTLYFSTFWAYGWLVLIIAIVTFRLMQYRNWDSK